MNIAYLLKPKDSVVWIAKNCPVGDGLKKALKNGYTAMPVISDGGEYFGTVTEGDFLRFVLDNPDETDWGDATVGSIIRKERNATVGISEDMNALLDRVVTQNFVPVVDDRDKFIGIVTRRSVIDYFRGLTMGGG